MTKKKNLIEFDNDFREKVLYDVEMFCKHYETVSINFYFTHDFFVKFSITNHVLNRTLDLNQNTSLIAECFNLFSKFACDAPRYGDIPTSDSLISLIKFSSNASILDDLIDSCFTPKTLLRHFLRCWNINVGVRSFYNCKFQFFRDKFFINEINL